MADEKDEHKHDTHNDTNDSPDTDKPVKEVEEKADSTPEPEEQATPAHEPHDDKPKQSFVAKCKAFVGTTKGKVILGVVAAVIIAVATLFAVPATRYGILGNFVKKDVNLTLVDSKTGKPITDASVDIPGQSGKSDNQGKVAFKNVPVGPQQVTIKKKFHKDVTQTVNVWLTKVAEPEKISVEATGRQVPVKVVNKISGAPLGKATVTAQESSAVTDDKGEAVLVVPADQATVVGTIKAEGYNDLAATVTVTEQADDKNTFAITPSGKVYFLSKRTGKINVMKSDLDGGNAQVVVAATGKEDDSDTVLLASRDWKYLMLKARRDSENPKLYLIETGTDKMTVADEGKANFYLTGWADHTFVYQVGALEANAQPRGSIKSFNAKDGKLTRLDVLESEPSHANFNQYYNTQPILIGNEVIYVKTWAGWQSYTWSGKILGKKNGVYSIKVDGSGKKALREADIQADVSYQARAYGADEVFIRTFGGDKKTYEYDEGKLVEESVTDDEFNKPYPTYLVSPAGTETFWSDSRDGKNVLFTGNTDGEDDKEILGPSEYRQYGWFTNDYLLVSKNNSELYILSRNKADKQVKITDYHKPVYNYYSYGGGYGGF